jgi:uncharacterized membrane protein YjjP (DUF1212 family)
MEGHWQTFGLKKYIVCVCVCKLMEGHWQTFGIRLDYGVYYVICVCVCVCKLMEGHWQTFGNRMENGVYYVRIEKIYCYAKMVICHIAELIKL